MRISQLVVSIIPLLAMQPAFADGPYYGGGLAVYSSTSEPFSGAGGESEDVYAAIGGTVGYRWDQAAMFVAAELDGDVGIGSDFEFMDVPCSDSADGPYYCEHTLTVRLRGVAGTDLGGGYEGFATAGLAVMVGEGAVESTERDRGVSSGYTVGLGAQKALGAGTLRFELNYDKLDNIVTKPSSGGTEYEPTLESISVKATYLFN